MACVWRVETNDGVGAYQCGAATYATGTTKTDPRRPTPPFDPGLMMGMTLRPPPGHPSDYYFGFSSLAQYKSWFHAAHERHLLAEYATDDDHMLPRPNHYEGVAPVVLHKYSVPNDYCLKGTFQAMFFKDHAKLVETRVCDAV